jgi:hypothetical protein
MPRFSLKRLLASVTIISIGFMLLAAIRYSDNGYGAADIRTAGPLWFAGGAAIGAGVMTPFKRTAWGAKLGMIVQLGLIVLYVIAVMICMLIYGV